MGPDWDGGGALTEGGAERADATELRLLPGMGSMLWRCLMPSTREALSGRAGTTAFSAEGASCGGRSTVT